MAVTQITREVIEYAISSITNQAELISQYSARFRGEEPVGAVYGDWQPGSVVRTEHTGATYTLRDALEMDRQTLDGMAMSMRQILADAETTDEEAAAAMLAIVNRVNGRQGRN